MKMFNPVFIVEGWSDVDVLRQAYPFIETIVTNGTRMNNRVRSDINNHMRLGFTPYVLSDPDQAGDQLFGMVKKEYPHIERIHVDKEQAKKRMSTRWKYGIEYCSPNYLKVILRPYMEVA
jgi:ribonuclease M5